MAASVPSRNPLAYLGVEKAEFSSLLKKDFISYLSPSIAGRYTPYVVSARGRAPFTRIQTAIDKAVQDGASATNQKLILLKDGPYTEDFTLYDGIIVSSPYPDGRAQSLRVNGQVNVASTGFSILDRIYLYTDSRDTVVVSPSSSGIFAINRSNLDNTTLGNALSVPVLAAPLQIVSFYSSINGATAGVNIQGNAGMQVDRSEISGPIAVQVSSGFASLNYSTLRGPVIADVGSGVEGYFSYFDAGASSCVTSNGGSTITLLHCGVNSSAASTNWADGNANLVIGSVVIAGSAGNEAGTLAVATRTTK